ncbi:hypothetical protein GA0070614_3916 [Micromonospora coxensis]|uniref:Uncharacterized protein n=1 Tax=Micromonospora coxensis TaxID=356852 RepID=A0A1C5J4U3_9ACTN|nr:hypothetical protein GA0070614_3916 [Micromonospora coxensis]
MPVYAVRALAELVLPLVSTLEPGVRDDDRPVDLSEDFVVLPEQTVDDTDHGWGERGGGNDDWLLAERPPHWD